MWNRCKYCDRRIEVGELCFGLPDGSSVCTVCCKPENGEPPVQVVRCKDCAYFYMDEKFNRAWCSYYDGVTKTAKNGYCYHGIRKRTKNSSL